MSQLRPSSDVPAIAASSRGLRYGDGVFVTLRIHNGVLLDAALQTMRLQRAAEAIGLRPPEHFQAPSEAAGNLAAIVAGLGPSITDGVVRVQWFAGAGPRGFGRESVRSDAIVDLSPEPTPRDVSLVVLPSGQVPLPALPKFKTCSALANILCAREALSRGADEAVRVDSGVLLETASANLFWFQEGILFTPESSLPLYPGSMRERILDCAPTIGIRVEEGAYPADRLIDAQTVIVANATRGIEVAQLVDGRTMGPPPDSLATLTSAVEAQRQALGISLVETGDAST